MIDLGSLSRKCIDVRFCSEDSSGSQIWRAVHSDLGQPVSIRALPRLSHEGTGLPDQFFRRGARAAAGLQHQNIIQVLDYEVTAASNLLVTEFVEGETLESMLQREGPLPLPLVFDIAWQISNGLEAAHERKRIHRNLKPSEIMMTPHGRVKLGGFEAAAFPDTDQVTPPVLGNAYYCAPEQMTGEPATAQSDMYALGVLIYSMLTGRLPVTASNAWAIVYQKLESDPPPPSTYRSGLPDELDRWIMKLLSRSPGDRFGDMTEFRRSLEQLSAPPAEPASLDDRIKLGFPAPIAHPYTLIFSEIEPLSRFFRLRDAFEATLKYCGAVALVSAIGQDDGALTDEMLLSLHRPSLGHWAGYLDAATRAHDSSHALRGQLRRFYRGEGRGRGRLLETINRLLAVRNEIIGHGATPSDRASEALFEAVFPEFVQVLEALRFLEDYPLARVQRLRFHAGSFLISYSACMGALPRGGVAEVQLSQPIEEGRLGLIDPERNNFLDLTPLLSFRVCPVCDDEEFFYYNGEKGKRQLKFLSYQKGHSFDEPFDIHPLVQRGLLQK